MFRPRRRINEGKEAGTMAMTVLWAGMAAAALTQLYGGTVALESEVGKGSAFTVTLPLARD